MVHGGHHGLYHLAVGEGQHTDLRTGEELLDDHTAARFPEHAVCHHIGDGLHGLLPGLGNDHALAQGQTVGLDDRGDGGGFQILEGSVQIIEDLVLCRGDAVFLHQVLGEDLAALNDGCVGAGAKAGNPLFRQRVHSAKDQRIVRRDHRIIDLVLRGKFHNPGNIRGADGNADRIGGNTAVSGQGVNRFHGRILFQLFDDGVFPSAAADY